MNLSAKLRARGVTAMKPGDSLTPRAAQNPGQSEAFFFLDGLTLYNIANGRKHWTVNRERAAEQRSRARNAMAGNPVPRLPVVVLITRCGPRKMDKDGNVISAKHVRDGVADAYGVDDADPRIEFEYAQQCPEEYSVCITITALPAGESGGGK